MRTCKLRYAFKIIIPVLATLMQSNCSDQRSKVNTTYYKSNNSQTEPITKTFLLKYDTSYIGHTIERTNKCSIGQASHKGELSFITFIKLVSNYLSSQSNEI